MQWILWKDQNELAKELQYHVDKGACREFLIKEALRDTKGKYTEQEITKELNNLLEKHLLIDNDDWIQVTEWAHDGIYKKFGEDCLNKLKKLKIFHKDMISRNIRTKDEIPEGYENISNFESSSKSNAIWY